MRTGGSYNLMTSHIARILLFFKRHGAMLLFVLPVVVIIAINHYIPMAGLLMAFQDIDNSKPYLRSPFNGIENFRFLFASGDAFKITRNTVLYNLMFIFGGLALNVAIAIAIRELFNKWVSKVYQTIIILPYFLSFVVVGYVVYAFLSHEQGFVNHTVLPFFGMDKIAWYNEPRYWPIILTMVNFWVYCGLNSIIYLASITSIDSALYESAMIDGASKRQQIIHVTLPMIAPVMIILTILGIGNIFKGNFGLFYQVPLANPILIPMTDVIDTYVYRALTTLFDFGMVTAASLYQSVVGCVLVLLVNRVLRKISPENALF